MKIQFFYIKFRIYFLPPTILFSDIRRDSLIHVIRLFIIKARDITATDFVRGSYALVR
jgi:hypothetical protein